MPWNEEIRLRQLEAERSSDESLEGNDSILLRSPDSSLLASLPRSFDPRRWNASCPTLSHVRDQGDCSASWSAAVASAASDRICLQSNRTLVREISAQDILSCCGWSCGVGCNGGFPDRGWTYLSTAGGVTGGDFNTTSSSGPLGGGCMPYQVPPCHFNVNGTFQPCHAIPYESTTPTCVRTCKNGVEWEKDKCFMHAPYALPSNSTTILAELFYHGPVTATFDLYQDFVGMLPNSIYTHAQGDLIGSLTVKLLGWGRDFGTDYYLATNSWSQQWGNGGYFKIARGDDACKCGIESAVMAASFHTCHNSTRPITT